jgi:hypothetical protein
MLISRRLDDGWPHWKLRKRTDCSLPAYALPSEGDGRSTP